MPAAEPSKTDAPQPKSSTQTITLLLIGIVLAAGQWLNRPAVVPNPDVPTKPAIIVPVKVEPVKVEPVTPKINPPKPDPAPTPQAPTPCPYCPPQPTPAPDVTPTVLPILPIPSVIKAISGPDAVKVGEIAEFTSPAGESRRWLVDPELSIRVFDDGQTIILPTDKPGRYVIFLAYGDGRETFAAKKVLAVEGSQPPPPPVILPVTPPDVPPPIVTPPPVPPTVKATAATYVYEQRDGPVPVGVLTALNRLNREKKIVATLIDNDTISGAKDIPKQYKTAVAAARAMGLPTLVVTAGDVVLKTVKAPTTEAAVMEAAQ